jgi:hypothetical protein
MCGGRMASTKLVSCSDVLRGGNGHRESKKNRTAANKTSPDAWDQAILFDTPGELICGCQRMAILPRCQQKFGFGAPKKKLRRSRVWHLSDCDNTASAQTVYGTYGTTACAQTVP